MRLDATRARELLGGAESGVLATLHRQRGVDAVPACFAVDGERLAVPVDRVKPKTGDRLQRVRNLEYDPRAVLLCDHWDGDDWTRLWWVRASLERIDVTTVDRASSEERLRQKYRQYRHEPFADLLVFRIIELTGWVGSDP